MTPDADSAEPTDELTLLRAQIEDLRATLDAIRTGGVDGVMSGADGDARLFTLTSADRPYRVLVEEMGEGAAGVSERGVVLYANRRLCELVGRTADDLVGNDMSTLVPAAGVASLVSLLSAGPTQTNRAELDLACADGTTVSVLSSATGLDIEGVLVRCLIVSDLSERRRNERLLARANAVVAEHAADLERANAELVRSNEEFSQFAYVAGHDLVEPLRSIGGFAGLLAARHQGRFDVESEEYLGLITAGVDRMHTLITNLLAYGRVGSETRPMAGVDTNRLLETVLTDLSARIKDLGAVVEVEALPVVHAEPGQLGRLFANLLGNGLNYVAPGVTPRLHVSAQPHPSGWCFTVADNGIGIAAADRERVFAMFSRLHSRDGYAGTGIGLAVVQKIVRRHGGEVWAEPRPGGGTLMRFTLPRLVPPQAATGSAGRGASVKTNLR